MARQRIIRPELNTHSKFVECSTRARLLFVMMQAFFDDNGIHLVDPLTFKMEVFPADNFTKQDISLWMKELIDNGMVVEFEREGKAFWHVLGWKDKESLLYQKLDHANPKYAPFDEEI